MATFPRLSIVCLATVIVFLDTSSARGSQTAEPPRVDRRMEVPVMLVAEGFARPGPEVLLEARQQAAMIYDHIDVSLVWTDESSLDEGTTPVRFVAIVLSDARTEQFLNGKDVPSSVLGVAPYQTGRVYLFWERIAKRAWENDVLPQIVLARVLAHEIGHHLLPRQGHSDSGIMRSTVDYRVGDPPAFTPTQAASIRQLLSEADLGD